MTSNSLKLLNLIINNASKYIDEINDESKNKLKKYQKYENLIRQTNHDLDDYDEKHIKIKFNSYYDLPLQKNVWHNERNRVDKYYPQVFRSLFLEINWVRWGVF